ncbi:phosphotransferase, partial [Rhodococcus wratislaviensis]|nr:phosphotransferase [Rhodococcus sp. 4CII]
MKGEFRFGQGLVRALLRDQHPDLADLDLRDVDGGWDNQQWRLGEELAVRLPRTERAPALLRTEQTWLPVLANRLPLPTPTPVRVGTPSGLFEHTFGPVRAHLDDRALGRGGAGRSRAGHTCRCGGGPRRVPWCAARAGARRRAGQPDAPANPARGIPLAGLWEGAEVGRVVVADHATAEGAREVWEEAVAAPVWQRAPLWLHGDVHRANVVVRDGMLAGVIDFGEMCAGDPATDLSAAWILLPAGAAGRFFDAYGRADGATVTQGAWLGGAACPGLDR